jgi:nucleotide-binding universal stress UspA family protein
MQLSSSALSSGLAIPRRFACDGPRPLTGRPHRRGQLIGLLLGSISQKLVSLAPCAVVVVP